MDSDLISQAVHRMDHRMAAIERKLDALLDVWQRHGHLVEAFARGGVLAARTARRNGRRQADD